jgi:hypothetical protein
VQSSIMGRLVTWTNSRLADVSWIRSCFEKKEGVVSDKLIIQLEENPDLMASNDKGAVLTILNEHRAGHRGEHKDG